MPRIPHPEPDSPLRCTAVQIPNNSEMLCPPACRHPPEAEGPPRGSRSLRIRGGSSGARPGRGEGEKERRHRARLPGNSKVNLPGWRRRRPRCPLQSLCCSSPTLVPVLNLSCCAAVLSRCYHARSRALSATPLAMLRTLRAPHFTRKLRLSSMARRLGMTRRHLEERKISSLPCREGALRQI